ncbi:MAG: HAD-IIIA family hydrolase [bacterium]|nr:HAD-IIIA family hydrolase [bacterium]
MKSYVFLDRDGTINIDYGYVFRPEQIDLEHGAAKAIASLCRSGFKVVVVSNQSAIGRGMASDKDVRQTNEELQRKLLAEDDDAKIDSFLYSPDAPGYLDASGCPSQTRKPATGLLRPLLEAGKVNVSGSWMLGDKLSDIDFGVAIGLPIEQNLHLLTGHGMEDREKVTQKYHGQVNSFPSIRQAVEFILSQRKSFC